jgi:hypothetical protein
MLVLLRLLGDVAAAAAPPRTRDDALTRQLRAWAQAHSLDGAALSALEVEDALAVLWR